jgi:DNA-binding transcriptional LysR family regulator
VDLQSARLFVVAAEHGSISAAARALGMARPTLSRRLGAFEDDLGLALLHRTTARVQPTDAGRRLMEGLRPLLDEADRLQASLAEEREGVVGCLRLSAPPVLAPTVSRLLATLMARHPQLEVELTTTTARVDLRSEGLDLALRAGRLRDPDLVQRRLGEGRARAYAAPHYLSAAAELSEPGQLCEHRLLLDRVDGRPRDSWPLLGGGRVQVRGSFVSDDLAALREAAEAGAGIALLDEATAASARQPLVAVLPDVVGAHLPLFAVWTRRDLQPARVRAFVDAAIEWFADGVAGPSADGEGG